ALKTLEGLREQLLYVKWSRETLNLLDQPTQELVQRIQDQPQYQWFAEPVARLSQSLNDYLGQGGLPQGVARERLLSALEGMNPVLRRVDSKTSEHYSSPGTGMAPPSGEVAILAGPEMNTLVVELENNGFQLSRLNTMAELLPRLAGTPPAAVIADMDYPEGALLASLNMVVQEHDRLDRRVPMIFISERGDLAARLEAVSAGGKAYFTKPINIQSLADCLYDNLQTEIISNYRVLLVQDNPEEASRLASLLKHRAITTEMVTQPRELLRHLYRFQPHLVLLDLDLGTLNGIELAKAIRQHEALAELPLLLLSAQPDLNPAMLELGSDDELLRKPLGVDYLLPIILNRLRRAQALSYKPQLLGQRDTVSGLYNRRYFLDQLERAVTKNRTTAVMLITLDNLRELENKDVNLADTVLEQAAKRLQAALEPGQLAGRFSNAMFAVLLSGTDPEGLLATARTLRERLEAEMYQVDNDATVRLRTSVGISTYRAEEDGDLPRLIQQADIACHIARDAGPESWRERIHLYNPLTDWEATVSQRQRLLDETQEALQQRRLGLVFQPIVGLGGDTSARYEIFLRMRNREGQELLPETVFGMVQNHRLGLLLERWVIGSAIRLLRERQAYNQPTTLFVNISPAVLQDEAITDWIKTALERTGVPPSHLVFEMAESSAEKYMPELCRFVETVRQLGCAFSLERFNGGEVGRTLLEKLTVDYVKLDPHFFRAFGSASGKQQELQVLVQELADRQITVVASGIENRATLQALRSYGMNYAQGFFLKAPDAEMSYDFVGNI
ncbi:MAG TPA: EAL domain-containing protein, partial [Candidatus Competibacteraceae bacterium]|nr:EAL domain-containing protein [Candidatus Competibacteraceae bacterium]